MCPYWKEHVAVTNATRTLDRTKVLGPRDRGATKLYRSRAVVDSPTCAEEMLSNKCKKESKLEPRRKKDPVQTRKLNQAASTVLRNAAGLDSSMYTCVLMM